MEVPVVNISNVSVLSNFQSFFPGRYSLYFLKMYIMQDKAEMLSAIIVANPAPTTPMWKPAINRQSSDRLMMQDTIRRYKGMLLFPSACKKAAHIL